MRGPHIAVLFPGQGVLDPAAFHTYRASCPELASILAEVDETARRFLRTSVIDALSRERYPGAGLDVLIFATSVAAYKRLQHQGLRPYMLLGHGFGEIAALVSAEALSLSDGAEIVVRRFLALASRKRRIAMASVQVSPGQVKTFLRILGKLAVSVAAENSSTQSVIVGPSAAIGAAEELARMLGIAFRRLRTTAGPHQSSMNGIQAELVRSLAHIRRRPAKVPVFSPLRGRLYRDDDDVVECLAQQLVEPLRFADAVTRLVADGVTLMIECGPLRGLAAHLDCTAIPDAEWEGGLLDQVEDDAATPSVAVRRVS